METVVMLWGASTPLPPRFQQHCPRLEGQLPHGWYRGILSVRYMNNETNPGYL